MERMGKIKAERMRPHKTCTCFGSIWYSVVVFFLGNFLYCFCLAMSKFTKTGKSDPVLLMQAEWLWNLASIT